MNGYLIEKKLADERPDLSALATDSAFVLKRLLNSFLTVFPDFTDHTILHSMNVLEYCNSLVGERQAAALTADECYVFIMACYMHDIGMGVSRKDYDEFSKALGIEACFEEDDLKKIQKTVRENHHEFSGLMIRKYKDLFEIPSEEHLFAIVQSSRGHRKTDLYDAEEYPDIHLPGGSVIRTAYIAAVLRLADETDVSSNRNPGLLYDTSQLTEMPDIVAFGTHSAIKSVEVTDDAIILRADGSSEYMDNVRKWAGKIEETLRYCADVCAKRTPFTISQSRVFIEEGE